MPSRIKSTNRTSAKGAGFDGGRDVHTWNQPGKEITVERQATADKTVAKEDEGFILKFRIPVKGIC